MRKPAMFCHRLEEHQQLLLEDVAVSHARMDDVSHHPGSVTVSTTVGITQMRATVISVHPHSSHARVMAS